jgi:hypothetical protein
MSCSMAAILIPLYGLVNGDSFKLSGLMHVRARDRAWYTPARMVPSRVQGFLSTPEAHFHLRGFMRLRTSEGYR